MTGALKEPLEGKQKYVGVIFFSIYPALILAGFISARTLTVCEPEKGAICGKVWATLPHLSQKSHFVAMTWQNWQRNNSPGVSSSLFPCGHQATHVPVKCCFTAPAVPRPLLSPYSPIRRERLRCVSAGVDCIFSSCGSSFSEDFVVPQADICPPH